MDLTIRVPTAFLGGENDIAIAKYRVSKSNGADNLGGDPRRDAAALAKYSSTEESLRGLMEGVLPDLRRIKLLPGKGEGGGAH